MRLGPETRLPDTFVTKHGPLSKMDGQHPGTWAALLSSSTHPQQWILRCCCHTKPNVCCVQLGCAVLCGKDMIKAPFLLQVILRESCFPLYPDLLSPCVTGELAIVLRFLGKTMPECIPGRIPPLDRGPRRGPPHQDEGHCQQDPGPWESKQCSYSAQFPAA